MSHRLIKKTSFITTIMFLLSLVSNIAAAEINMTMYVLPFKDITADYWGTKDIIKLSQRGVVTGYDDAKFYPAKPVTQIEALLMAVRNRGVKAQLASIDQTRPLPISVPDWVEKSYKKEVLYALDQGLLIPSENNFLATANATRAWIAQLTIRMINKSSEASALASQKPSFLDASSIPSWAKGAINTSAKYKLITGYPDSTFKPNQNITRVELVTLFSRSEQYLNLNETLIIAKLVSLTGQNITLAVNGNLKTITRTQNTWVFDAQGKLASAANLKENDVVKIILTGPTANYIEIMPAETVLTKLQGTLLQLLLKEKLIVVKDELQKIHTKTLSSGLNTATLTQLEVGTEVELGLAAKGEVVNVQLLTNQGPVSSAGISGIIYDLNPAQKLLLLKDSSGEITAYQYNEQVIVKISDQRFPLLQDLAAGDEVKLKLSAGTIAEIELVKAKQQLTFTGVVVLISPEKSILTIQKDNNSLEAYPISDAVEIKISGLIYPQLSNVLVNDQAELVIEEGKVTTITIKDRSVSNLIIGTVAAIDTTNKILTLKTEKNELKTFDFSPGAEFLIDDRSTTSLSDVKKDMKVELQLVDNKVIYLETKNTIIGTIEALDSDRRIITLKANNSDAKTYVISSSVDIDIEGVSSPSLADLNKDNLVEIRLEENIVSKINVQTASIYQVTNLYINSKELRVSDKNGYSKYLNLTNRVVLVMPDKTSASLEAFTVGTIIRATFLGNKLSKVETIPTVRGRITGINTLTNSITFQSFEGATTSYTFNSKSEVQNGLQKYYQLNALAVGDRVSIREKEDSGFTFSIMEKTSVKYQGLSDDGKKLIAYKELLYLSTYDLATNAYIHTGSQLLTTRNLVKDNQLDLYSQDDLVYEVDKK